MIAALWIGVDRLYVPMVSVSYQQLYTAYCRGDAIPLLLSRQVGEARLLTAPIVDECRMDPPPPKLEARIGLASEEAYFLLGELGLLDPTERGKTAAEVLNAKPATPNQGILKRLIDPRVYYAGEPTSALLVRLAGEVASGSYSNSGLSGAAGAPSSGDQNKLDEAGWVSCVTSGLSAIMAQQPFILGNPNQTIGRALLDKYPTVTMKDFLMRVVSFQPAADASRSNAFGEPCAGDKTLGKLGLGRDFAARTPAYSSPLSFPLLSRPATQERLNDSQIVDVALAWAHYPPQGNPVEGTPAVIAFMRAISSEASGVPDVRDARIAGNFFMGWERLAILVVSTFLALCLLWQQALNLLAERDFRYIRNIIEIANGDGQRAIRALKRLRRVRYRNLGRSGPQEVMVAAIEVAEQLQAGSGVVDFERVRRVAEHEIRIGERRRFFFLAGLPLLPTIGFIGTVRSLIEALAIADNIPRARNAVDQVAAVSEVTATLSLCFSTTFMALCALLVFAPLDLWQSTGERRLIEETERLLDPGI